MGVGCWSWLSVLSVGSSCWLLSVGCRGLTVDCRSSLLWLLIVYAGCHSVFPLSVPTSVSISDAFGDAKSIHSSVGLNIEILLKISVYY